MVCLLLASLFMIDLISHAAEGDTMFTLHHRVPACVILTLLNILQLWLFCTTAKNQISLCWKFSFLFLNSVVLNNQAMTRYSKFSKLVASFTMYFTCREA